MKNVYIVTFSDIGLDPRPKRQVELFASLGIHVRVFCNGNVLGVDFGKNVYIEEINLSRRSKSFIENLSNYYLFFAFLLKKIKIDNKKKSIDLILFNNMPNFLVFSIFRKRKAFNKVAIDVHDSLYDLALSRLNIQKKIKLHQKFLLWILSFEEKYSLRFCDEVITVNNCFSLDIMKRNGLKNVTVIHNVQDNYIKYKKINKTNFPSRNIINFIHHGNINKQNGIQNIYDILPDIAHDFRLHILGDGVYLQKLKELADEKKIAEKIIFTGSFAISDLSKLMPPNPIAMVTPDVTSHNHQALHVKVLDYCIMGVPVICQRLDTLEHYFGQDSIFFYDDLAEIPRLVTEIQEDKNAVFRRTRNAQRVVQDLSWIHEKSKLINLLENDDGQDTIH